MTADASPARATVPQDRRRMLPICEAAAMLGVTPRYLKRLHLAGDLPGAVERLGRKWMIKRAWVDEFTAWPGDPS